MKICIDGIGASLLRGTGIYTYTYELLQSLLDFYPQPHYHVVWDKSSTLAKPINYNAVSYASMSLDRRSNDFCMLDKYLKDNKINLFHSPNNGMSIAKAESCKYVISVHDVLPFNCSKYVDGKYLEKYLSVLPRSALHCDKIIAASCYVKKTINTSLDIPLDKIEVIYPGCSSIFKPLDKNACTSIIKKRYGIDSNFIFYAGSIHIRKKLDELLMAFKEFCVYEKNFKLVIAGKIDGKRKEYYDRLTDICKKLGVRDSVVFTGIIDYSDMVYLYNSCLCFVNLSEYEGFPMTVVEAMACGAPVICSNASSFKEAAGGGAVFVENKEVNDIKEAMLEMANNEIKRSALAEAGKRKAGEFTWEGFAKGIAGIYEKIIYAV